MSSPGYIQLNGNVPVIWTDLDFDAASFICLSASEYTRHYTHVGESETKYERVFIAVSILNQLATSNTYLHRVLYAKHTHNRLRRRVSFKLYAYQRFICLCAAIECSGTRNLF